MLREVIDIASLEDFTRGVARCARLRVCVYDQGGELITATAGDNEFARLTGHVLGSLPADMRMTRVPAHDPPAQVAFVQSRGVWYVVAPVYVEDRAAGYVALGEYRACGPPPVEDWSLPAHRSQSGGTRLGPPPATGREIGHDALANAWETLPELDRGGSSHAVVTVRWIARQLAEWSHRESRLVSAAREVTLVGDVAELLTGQQDLQEVLDRIVAETARVMGCPYSSIRLYDPKTNELTIKAVHRLSPDYVGKGAIVRTAGAVSDAALRGEIVYVEDVASDPRVQYPEQARRQGIASMLTAGMIYRGNPVGVIRVYTSRKQRFRQAQRNLLRAVAYQAATAIVHAQLVEDRLRNAETERQLSLAGDLQTRMMRTPPPRHPLLSTAVAFHPTFEVAGDFCDFLTLSDGRLAAVIGDVVGKGIPASLLMSSARGALQATADYCASPGELLSRLNRQICRQTLPSEFITLLLLAFDADARRLTYASAGHEPLLLLRDGQVLESEQGNLVLGVEPAERYDEHALALRPDDLLLLYTDGAVEALDFDDKLFGRERLRESLRTWGGLGPDQVLSNIVWDIRRFVGLAEQSDDLTLLAVRVLPDAPARA